MVKSVAICVFGNKKLSELSIPVISEHQVVFNVANADCWKSLWLTANAKRNYEIDNHVEFNLCLGINTPHVSILDTFKLSSTYDKETFYFYDGYFTGHTVGINPTMFLASSHIFDIVSHYHVSLHGNDLAKPEEFYHFIKKFAITTQCINYENSSLFKRPT